MRRAYAVTTRSRRVALVLLAAAGLPVAAASAQTTIDFSGLGHGKQVTTQYAGLGLTVAANNFSKPFDMAITFDTTRTGTADPDLEDPWERGNIASNAILGNVLIIAENNRDANNDGFIDSPDDEGNRPAGEFIFTYFSAITSFGFDILDIEGTAQENGSIRFISGSTTLKTVTFAELVNPLSPFYDSTIVFGDESANRIRPFTTASLGVGPFDKIVIRLGGSGAVDNLTWTPTIIPAPGVAGLLAVAGLAATRRRR